MDDSTSNQPDAAEDFVRLLIEHEPMVRSFLRGLVPAWNDVDEVIQNASLIAWRKFSEFEPGTAFGGWFLTIARFEALKHRTKIARSPLIFVDHLWETLAEEAQEDTTVVTRYLEVCLAKLDPQKRVMLMQVYSPGVTMRDVAKAAGKSEQAFYKIIQRLRQTLMDCVSKLKTAEANS
jgi:RNA polymerase sigma-70 factor (ECF subfamily)